MRKLMWPLISLVLAILSGSPAQAQSGCAAIAYGAVLTAGQWQACFQAKSDFSGSPSLPIAGGVMTGPIVTAASTAATAGFNIPQGIAPTTPNNGDVWTTSAGMYVRINGATVGPLTSGGASGSFTSTYPVAVTFPSAGVVNYALNYDANFTTTSNNLALASIASGNLIANSTSGSGEPISTTLTALIDRAMGSAQGTVLNRGASVWTASATPTLGKSGTLGSLTFGNATSGLVTLQAVTGALGTVTASLPANTGTIAETNYAETWSAPQSFNSGDLILNGSTSGSITLNAVAAAGSSIATLPANTGTIAELNLAQSWTAVQTFETSGINLLGTGTGYTTFASANSSAFNYTLTFPALTDTVVTVTSTATLTNKTFSSLALAGTTTGNNTIPLPILVQVNGGTVLGNNGSSLANVAATSTPVLGIAGSVVGTLGFANATTGSITLQPVTGALGSAVLTMPAVTDTLVTLAAVQTLTNKTLVSSTDVLGGVTTTLGSDATGDVYYRNSSGVLTRLGIGSTYNALVVSGGLPSWGQINLASSAAITGALPLANIANLGASSLFGNPTGSPAPMEAITLGSTLNFSGTTLNCTSASPTQVGCVEPDNVTIQITGGKLVAVGASATSVTALGTSVSGGVATDIVGMISSGCSGATPCLANFILGTGLSLNLSTLTINTPWTISGNNIASNNSGYVAVTGGSFFIENVSSVSTPVSGTYFYSFSNAGTAFIGEYNYSTSTYLPVTIGNSAISVASGGVATTIPTLYAYTAPGTGGQTNTVQTTTQRVLYLSDFTTVQEAITEAQTLGVKLICDGTYSLPNGGVTISAPLVFEGTSACLFNAYTGSVGVYISTVNAIWLKNITVNYSAQNAGNYAFEITAVSGSNTYSHFDNINTNGNACVGIFFQNANSWTLTNSALLGYCQGMIVQNSYNVDEGDSYASGNLFESATGGAAVEWNSSGGLKFIGNKINGTNMSYGFLVALASGATTGDLFIEGNSIEGISSSGYGIEFVRQGSTGAMATVNIANNELTGYICLYIPTDANGVWLGGVSITGNNCLISSTGAAYSIDSTAGFNISGGVSQSLGSASRNIAIGPAASVCSLGPVVRWGSFSNSSLPGSCSTVGSY